MTNRSATDKLIGYFYQFDRTILELLTLPSDSDEITTEGLEDIDINGFSGGENIQVKYYTTKKIILDDKTLSTDKEIGKSILLLLLTFLNTGNKQTLLGYYLGQDTQEKTLSLEELNSIISHSKSKITNVIELGKINSLTIEQKNGFISKFKIKIVDKNYEDQIKQIYELLKVKFGLSGEKEIDLYYNYGLSIITQLTAKLDITDRKITKGDFIKSINQKEVLFNFWSLEKIKLDKYLKIIKKTLFNSRTIGKIERIVIIEIKESDSAEKIKSVILKIKQKFLKRHENIPKPYFFLNGITAEKLLELKNKLWLEKKYFEDGYYYNGNQFQILEFTKSISWNGHIRLRLLNNIDDLELVIDKLTGTTELLEFYLTDSLNINTDKIYKKFLLKDIENVNNLFN